MFKEHHSSKLREASSTTRTRQACVYQCVGLWHIIPLLIFSFFPGADENLRRLLPHRALLKRWLFFLIWLQGAEQPPKPVPWPNKPFTSWQCCFHTSLIWGLSSTLFWLDNLHLWDLRLIWNPTPGFHHMRRSPGSLNINEYSTVWMWFQSSTAVSKYLLY